MNSFETGISADSVDTVHPILRPITKLREIDQFNSAIIYSKGASVLRMTEFVMGTEKFYAALRVYLQVNAYKNVRETDLFKQLDAQFPTDFAPITATSYLNNWIKEKGFPYITLTREGNNYRVKQQRFLFSGSGDTSTLWTVPISFYTDQKWSGSSIRFLTDAENAHTFSPHFPNMCGVV